MDDSERSFSLWLPLKQWEFITELCLSLLLQVYCYPWSSMAFIFNGNWLYCFECLINVVKFPSPSLHLLCLELVTNTDGYKNISFIADKAELKNKAFSSFIQELESSDLLIPPHSSTFHLES